MPVALLLACALVLALVPASIRAEPPVADAPPLAAALGKHLAQVYPADGPGAAVLVVKGDEVVYRGAHGLANLETPATLEAGHRFRIGSLTKTLTAILVLRLAQEGRLGLDDPIEKHLTDWPAEGITVRHLLHQASGIQNYTLMPAWLERMREDIAAKELAAIVRAAPRVFEAGSSWGYSNSNYILLGLIAEAAAKQPFDEALRERVLLPFGMQQTQMDDPLAVIKGRVRGYEYGPSGLQNAAFISMSHAWAAGGLISTVDDLWRLEQGIRDGKVLDAEHWKQMMQHFTLPGGGRTPYGMGLFLRTHKGEAVQGHWGRVNGFRAAFVRHPTSRVFVCVLSNAGGRDPSPGVIASRLAKAALGEALPEVQVRAAEAAVSAEEAARLDVYVGRYKLQNGWVVEVVRKGAYLVASAAGQPAVRMVSAGAHRFSIRRLAAVVTFVVDEQGRVSGGSVRVGTQDLSLEPLPTEK